MILEEKAPILVVDDDAWMSSLVAQSLNDLGYTNVTVCHGGQQALDKLHLMPELVILDHSMPGLSGLETLKRLKAQAPNTDVVFLSGQDDIEVSVDALRYGAFDYVLKNEDCVAQVAAVMERRKALEVEAETFLKKERRKEMVKNLLVVGTLALLLCSQFGLL